MDVRSGWSGWSGAQPAGHCLPMLILFPCIMKSRSSLLAPADQGGPGKRGHKMVVMWWFCGCLLATNTWLAGVSSFVSWKHLQIPESCTHVHLEPWPRDFGKETYKT